MKLMKNISIVLLLMDEKQTKKKNNKCKIKI